MRKAHCSIWNMARNILTLENDKCTLQILEYGKKTENHGKCVSHTVGRGLWRETFKNLKNEKWT